MNELRRRLTSIVRATGSDTVVALALSAGLDSLITGFACEEVGKEVRPYTYELQGYRSHERSRVEAIARHFGWPLRVVTIPTRNIASDFKRLAIDFGCRTKVQFEVAIPLLHLFAEVTEREIWTGFNADDHFGNVWKIRAVQERLLQAGIALAERRSRFDEHLAEQYRKFDEPGSQDSWWVARAVAASCGKDLFDPYHEASIREYFRKCDHDQLRRLDKPLLREAFADRLASLPENLIAKGQRLQKGGRVHELTKTLLTDADVNRFGCRTVSGLCQRWGKAVEAAPDAFAEELKGGTERQPCASVRLSGPPVYSPYTMDDVNAASALRKFTFVSTFAGGAGSSTGYRLAGGYGPLVNEFVPEAARTYRTNFPACIVDQRDIRELSASDESVAEFLDRAGLYIAELDLLDGSPPCCEFSTAGRGIGDQDVLRHYSDVKQSNIASLPFDFGDLVHHAKPKVFVCENVPAFESRGREVFHRFIAHLGFRGEAERLYYVNWAVLTASDFGVPQKRQRLFVIGIRKDVGDAIGFASDEAVRDVFPAPTLPGVTIRSAFIGLDQTDEELWPWRRSAMVSRLPPLMRLLPKDPPKPTRLSHVYPECKSHYTLTRCAWDKPAPTLVVTGQRPDGLTGAIHPDEDRKFTLPELKRLTGLPDDFVLTGTLGQAAERVCRMVPPFLTKAIADSIYQKILLPYAEAKK